MSELNLYVSAITAMRPREGTLPEVDLMVITCLVQTPEEAELTALGEAYRKWNPSEYWIGHTVKLARLEPASLASAAPALETATPSKVDIEGGALTWAQR